MNKNEKELLLAFYALFGEEILEQAKALIEDSTPDAEE